MTLIKYQKNLKSILNNLFLFFLGSYSILEFLNGILLNNNEGISLFGYSYKLLFFIVAFLLLPKKKRSWSIIGALIFLAMSIVHIFSQPYSTQVLISEFQFLFRISMFPVIFMAIQETEVHRNRGFLYWILGSTLAILELNILLGVFGIGHTQYLSHGFLGFFYSGNEFAHTMIIVFATLLYLLYKDKKYKLAVIVTLISIPIAFKQGMKTILLGIPLFAIAVPFFSFDILGFLKSLPKKKLRTLVISVLLSLTVAILIIPRQYYYRFVYLEDNYGIAGALTAGRNNFVKGAIESYESYPWYEKIIGTGKLKSEKDVGKLIGMEQKTVESDPMDLLLSFGALGVILYFSIWISAIYREAYKNKFKINFSLLIQGILFISSVITGHVIYSTILAVYWSLALYIGQKKKKTDVYFIGPTTKGGIKYYMETTATQINNDKINIEIINTHSFSKIKMLFLFATAKCKLLWYSMRSVIRNNNIVFHYHTAAKFSFVRKFTLALTSYLFADKQIIHIHSGEMSDFFKSLISIPFGIGKLIIKLFFSLFDTVIIVSETLSNEMKNVLNKANLDVGMKNWHVLRNALDLKNYNLTPKKISQSKTLKIIFAGRLEKPKNIPMLVAIANEIKARKINAQITIIGSGEYEKWLIEEIKTKKLEKTINFKGWVERNKINAVYREHDLFLLPSTHESFGLVLLEAYANGLPSVSSNVGGLKDIVVEGETGYTFEPNDIDGFVTKIESFLKNRKQINKMSKYVQKYVKQYDYPEHIKNLISLLKI